MGPGFKFRFSVAAGSGFWQNEAVSPAFFLSFSGASPEKGQSPIFARGLSAVCSKGLDKKFCFEIGPCSFPTGLFPVLSGWPFQRGYEL